MHVTSFLYQAARKSRDIEILLSMDGEKIIKHFLVNKFLMKKLGKSVLWKK